MSHIPIVEWSPESCLIVESSGNKVANYSTPTEAVQALGKPKKIILALGRRQVFVKSVRLPDVSVEEARNLIRFRLEDIFPIPAHEVAYDLAATDDVNSDGREFVVVATKGDTLRQAKLLFSHAGTKVEHIVLAALGSIQMADSNVSSIVLSPCAEGIAFDVVDRGHLVYSRVAGYATTSAEIDAELNRVTAASGVSNPITIAHTALKDLVSSNAKVTNDHPLVNLAHHLPAVNLRLPEDLAKIESKKLSSRKRLAALLCLSLIVAIVNAWIIRDEESVKAKKIADQYKSKIESQETITARNNAKVKEFETQDEMVEDGVEPRQSLADVVTVVANAAPSGLWLTGLTLERGKDLSIRGTALSNAQVGALNDALSATPRLRDVKLVFSNNNTIGDVPIVQFSMSAHVVGNLPLTEPKKNSKNAKAGK